MGDELAKRIADTLDEILGELKEMNARERTPEEIRERQKAALDRQSEVDGGNF